MKQYKQTTNEIKTNNIQYETQTNIQKHKLTQTNNTKATIDKLQNKQHEQQTESQQHKKQATHNKTTTTLQHNNN